jgi:hypothetical protein
MFVLQEAPSATRVHIWALMATQTPPPLATSNSPT